MASTQQQMYQRLMAAIVANNAADARACITQDFAATFPAQTEMQMSFGVYLDEIERQRKVFSDLGQNVEVLNAVGQGSTLMVHYRLTVTYDGPLATWSGAKIPRPAQPQKLSFTSVDIVKFAPDGRIQQLTVVSDRLATIFAMAQSHQ